MNIIMAQLVWLDVFRERPTYVTKLRGARFVLEDGWDQNVTANKLVKIIAISVVVKRSAIHRGMARIAM